MEPEGRLGSHRSVSEARRQTVVATAPGDGERFDDFYRA